MSGLVPYAGSEPVRPGRHLSADDEPSLRAAIKSGQQQGLLLREIAERLGLPLFIVHDRVLEDLQR